ncbi:hypothetical protein WA158_003867 [Blastocystis sp. Blastoise]
MIVEFRIALPIDYKDVDIAYHYMICKAVEEVTGGGEGCDWADHKKITLSDPTTYETPIHKFHTTVHEAFYEYKKYSVMAMCPAFAKKILPKEDLVMDEETIMADHYSQSINTLSCFEDNKFKIYCETKFINKNDAIDNVFDLTEKELNDRTVFTYDLFKNTKLRKICDMSTFHSEKKNIGPFQENWIETTPNICYFCRVLKVDVNIFGIGQIICAFFKKQQEVFNQQICLQMLQYMDEWSDMTMNDMENYEENVRKELKQLIHQDKKENIFMDSINV